MGIFDFFKKKQIEKQNMTYANMLNGTTPIFSQYGDDIYASDVVNQALYTIVTEVKKLNPKHIRKKGFDVVAIDDTLQSILDDPNELMTTSDFLEKITWNYLLHYNSFIYVERDFNDNVIGLYPLSPTNVTFLEGGSVLYVSLSFPNGSKHTIPYSSLIHIKSHYSINDYMGGNEAGQPNNVPLLQTLKLNDILLQGVKKSLQSSFAINGVVKYNTMLDDGSMKENIAKFEEQLKNNNSGLLGIDNKSEFIQLNRNIQIVDEPTLKFIDDKILRNFGTPIEIVRGDYTMEQYEAFYQKTIEPIVITFSQAFTKALFTKKQNVGFKNSVVFYTKELVFMNTSQKLAMIKELGASGTLFENEKRVAFGYEPLPELVGVRLQSLNYVDVSIAKEYQVGSQPTETNGGENDE